MVYVKELRNKNDTFTCLVDRKEDAAESGTCLISRRSLRHPTGENAAVNASCFQSDMSEKLDLQESDACARHTLKSTLESRNDRSYQFRLLGRDIISGSWKWGNYNLKIYGGSAHIPGYWEWTEDVLARCGDILKTSSIYQAVYASLYSYDKNLNILRAFFECWCPKTNTLHTREGELSISLWDLKKLGGLPIQGEVYDETVPQTHMFKESDATGNKKLPKSCVHLFSTFHRLQKTSTVKGVVTARQWIKFWCLRTEAYGAPETGGRRTVGPPPRTQNPSGALEPGPFEWTSEEKKLFTRFDNDQSTWPGIYLAAFLSCWLCSFVLPEDDDREIRPTTFEIAGMLAEGRQVSLAVPVLAKIYRGLKELVTSSNPSYSKSFFPAHYLFGWLAEYFGTHHCVDPLPPVLVWLLTLEP